MPVKININRAKECLISLDSASSNVFLALEGVEPCIESWEMYLFNKRVLSAKYQLTIDELNCGDFILNGKEQFLQIQSEDSCGEKVDIDVKEIKTRFSVVLNQAAIAGYAKSLSNSSNKCEISFRLKAIRNDKVVAQSDIVIVPVTIKCPTIGVNLQVEILSDMSNLTYNPYAVERLQIGNLLINHNFPFHGAPELLLKFKTDVKSAGKSFARFLLLDETCVSESNPVYASRIGGINVVGINPSVLTYATDDSNGPTIYKLNHICCKDDLSINDIRIPLYMDMSRISNPIEEIQEYIFGINGCCVYSLFNETKSTQINVSKVISVRKNPQLTKLRVTYKDSSALELPAESRNSGSTFDWGSLQLMPNVVKTLKLSILNEAIANDVACPNASILVKNFRVKKVSCEEDRIVMTHTNIQHEEYFTLRAINTDSPAYNNWPQEIRLYSSQSAHYDSSKVNSVELALTINSNHIAEITRNDEGCFTAPVAIEYEFDYATDTNGNLSNDELQMCSYSGRIIFKLEQSANPIWLSVDSGTSAIVATLATGYERGVQPIDLNEKKYELLRKTFPGKGEFYDREKFDDEASPFISSEIALNSTFVSDKEYDTLLCHEEFIKYPLWLSPSNSVPHYTLPGAKAMIGYVTLPNVLDESENSKFSHIVNGSKRQLFDNNGNGIVEYDNAGVAVERGLLYVNNILKLSYQQLFRHYLSFDEYGAEFNVDRLNKLVLSVPNTFTPRHRTLLKSIVTDTFRNIRPQYLKIVSESDAVACYYLANREYFINNSSELNEDIKVKLRERSEERILVFDMGAGTLDITYFVRSGVEGSRMNIDMLGKLGVNKAGNYLDYLLGQILLDFLRSGVAVISDVERGKFEQLLELDKGKRIKNKTNRAECAELKRYLRDILKPLLNTPEADIPQFKNIVFKSASGEPIKVDAIRQHGMYSQFLKECTNEVLDNLKSLMNTNSAIVFGAAIPLQQLKVDMFVFSGRSTMLRDIRTYVADYIKENSEDGERVMCADLISETIVDIDSLISDVIEGELWVDDLEVEIELVPDSNPDSALDDEANDLIACAETVSIDSCKLKSVVTCGSLVYAEWSNQGTMYSFGGKKIFANYGVLIKNAVNQLSWLPLITPYSPEQPVPGNIYVSTYPQFIGTRENLDISNIRQILFVQSYSSTPAEDWSNGKRDMISVITEWQVCDNAPGRVKIQMEIDNNNAVKCIIGGVGEILNAPNFNDISLRKSLWPVVFPGLEQF